VILRPCIAHLPRNLRGREGVQAARKLARLSLERCASRLGLEAQALSFPRDAERAPQPMDHAGQRWHWSTTNTKGLVAGLLGPTPLAVDAEWLGRPRQAALAAYLPGAEVRALGLPAGHAELALWSAKEAVIKLTGIGMAAMGRTALKEVLGQERLLFSLDGRTYQVLQNWQPEHVISVACGLLDSLESIQLEVDALSQQELPQA
jgi:hypothetical protein